MSTETQTAKAARAEIEQIRERADAASRGPWWPMCMGSEGWNIRNDEIGGTVRERKPLVARVGYGEWEQDKANVAFIVNARSDVPGLLAAYDVMKQQRDEAQQEYEDLLVMATEAFATVERVRKAETWDEIHAALHSEGS